MIMASDDLSDEERELIAQHRAARKTRQVKVRGKLKSGADYEFDAEPDEAERLIRRHPELAESDDDDPQDDPKPAKLKAADEPSRHFGRRVS
jgi:hypothetical protein